MAEIDQHCWFWYFVSTSAAFSGRISHHCWFQYFPPCLGLKFYHCWFWCCIITIYCFKLQDLATSAIWSFLPTYALNCRIDHQRWFWYFLPTYALNCRIDHQRWFWYFLPTYALNCRIDHQRWIWYFLPTYALNCRIDHQRWFWYFLPTYALNCRIDHQRWFWYFLLTYALNCRIDHQCWFWYFLLSYATTDYLQSVFRLEGHEKSRAVSLIFFFQITACSGYVKKSESKNHHLQLFQKHQRTTRFHDRTGMVIWLSPKNLSTRVMYQ
jgi:hypothetical protein